MTHPREDPAVDPLNSMRIFSDKEPLLGIGKRLGNGVETMVLGSHHCLRAACVGSPFLLHMLCPLL